MEKKRDIIILASLVLLLWAIFGLYVYFVMVPRQMQAFDLFPRWYGARQMLQGINPYALGIIDQLAPTADGGIGYRDELFLYPAQITYILLPFWLIPFPLSVSIWSGLQMMLMLSLPLFVFHKLRWNISPALLLFVVLFSSFVYRHPIHIYLWGQFAIFILACLIIAWWQLVEDGHPLAVAVPLVAATIRPEGIVFVAGFLAYLIVTKRFVIMAWWTGIMTVLTGLSFLQIGFWIPQFLDGIFFYQDAGLSTSAAGSLELGWLIGFFRVAFIVWATWFFIELKSKPMRLHVIWGLAVFILVTLVVFPQSGNHSLVYALLPIWLYIWAARDKWYSVPIGLAILCSPWLYIYFSPDNRSENEIELLITPIIIAVMLTSIWWQTSRGEQLHVPDENLATPVS